MPKRPLHQIAFRRLNAHHEGVTMPFPTAAFLTAAGVIALGSACAFTGVVTNHDESWSTPSDSPTITVEVTPTPDATASTIPSPIEQGAVTTNPVSGNPDSLDSPVGNHTLPVSNTCQEDEPCWDCRIFGNRTCGVPLTIGDVTTWYVIHFDTYGNPDSVAKSSIQ